MPKVRKGKTARDHANNAHATRLHNRNERIAWQKEVRGKGGKGMDIPRFPLHTCNGKKSRRLKVAT